MLFNPPFGTRIKEARATTLSQFELGYEWIRGKSQWERTDVVLDGRETGILFAELSEAWEKSVTPCYQREWDSAAGVTRGELHPISTGEAETEA